ncbi:hypothetical protein [Tsukamurella sp. 1534]|uniref:hypothetical protein n=1 Tax=Tsukamurella sp. 1534 TaxID=1151061 RepID=UPI0002D5E8FE|nr:hypothetical protein [Tsukamurella sp. 1534]
MLEAVKRSTAAAVDLGTRKFWRATGRPIDLDGEEYWLRAPTAGPGRVGAAWLEAEAARRGGHVHHALPGAGLIGDWAQLAGPGFDPAALHPAIDDFYRHTANWRMEVWSSWSPQFRPGDELVTRGFGKRVQQLALPLDPLEVSRGLDGTVSVLTDSTGTQVAAGWIRTLRLTGDVVFSGCYTTRTLPGADRPSVHVTFPLEAGNLQVFLRPHNRAGGALELSSPPGRWGADGAYVAVRDAGRDHAKRVPLHESFRLYVDDEQVLRTDHVLRFGRATALRLHYRLTRRE